MSFVDKVARGAALMLIEEFMPFIPENSEEKYQCIRYILVCGCGCPSIVGLLLIAILWQMKIGKRWKEKSLETDSAYTSAIDKDAETSK